MVNVMLLARDMNGRRIYTSKADLAAALNVGELYTAEQFEGLVRMDDEGHKHKLLGIFVNLTDYTVGSTKGGRDRPVRPVRHRLQPAEVPDRDPAVRCSDPRLLRHRSGGARGCLRLRRYCGGAGTP